MLLTILYLVNKIIKIFELIFGKIKNANLTKFDCLQASKQARKKKERKTKLKPPNLTFIRFFLARYSYLPPFGVRPV